MSPFLIASKNVGRMAGELGRGFQPKLQSHVENLRVATSCPAMFPGMGVCSGLSSAVRLACAEGAPNGCVSIAAVTTWRRPAHV